MDQDQPSQEEHKEAPVSDHSGEAPESNHSGDYHDDDYSQDYDDNIEYEEYEDRYDPPRTETEGTLSSGLVSDDAAMWDFYRYYQNHDDYRNYFEPTYYCHPLSKTNPLCPENGDKVIMPASALESLMHLDVEYPMNFRIENGLTGRASHCGVLEFTAEEGSVLLPDWMMKNLGLEDGDLVNMKSVRLEKAEHLKLRPHKMEFVTGAADPKEVLESTLWSFSCLSAGDTILINNGNRSYHLDVLETRPGDAVSVNETDCEVDFAPPRDNVEKPRVVEEPSPSQGKARRGKVVFGSAGVAEPAKEEVKDETQNQDEPKFVAFSGKKYTLH